MFPQHRYVISLLIPTKSLMSVISQKHVNGKLCERPVQISWQGQTHPTCLYAWVQLSWVSVQTGSLQTLHLQLPFSEATCGILMVILLRHFSLFFFFFPSPLAEEGSRTILNLRKLFKLLEIGLFPF